VTGGVWQLNYVGNNQILVSGYGFIFGTSPYNFAVGDKIRLVVKGSHAYLFYVTTSRGVIPLGAGMTTATPAAGKTGLEILNFNTTYSETGWSAFTAGSVA
jgi:hypothetical protein